MYPPCVGPCPKKPECTKHKYLKSVIRTVKGATTKAYVLSENRSREITLANVINAAGNTAIMNERESDNYTELIEKAVERLGYGYDLTVLVTRKPMEANIEANKTNKLRAVVCRTQADASMARKAKVNLIIMDDNEFSKTSASSIMRGWLGSEQEEAYDEEPEKGVGITEMGRSALGILNSGVSMMKKPSRSKASAEREKKVEEDETEDISKPKDGGIIKNIKYIFGIE